MRTELAADAARDTTSGYEDLLLEPCTSVRSPLPAASVCPRLCVEGSCSAPDTWTTARAVVPRRRSLSLAGGRRGRAAPTLGECDAGTSKPRLRHQCLLLARLRQHSRSGSFDPPCTYTCTHTHTQAPPACSPASPPRLAAPSPGRPLLSRRPLVARPPRALSCPRVSPARLTNCPLGLVARLRPTHCPRSRPPTCGFARRPTHTQSWVSKMRIHRWRAPTTSDAPAQGGSRRRRYSRRSATVSPSAPACASAAHNAAPRGLSLAGLRGRGPALSGGFGQHLRCTAIRDTSHGHLDLCSLSA